MYSSVVRDAVNIVLVVNLDVRIADCSDNQCSYAILISMQIIYVKRQGRIML